MITATINNINRNGLKIFAQVQFSDGFNSSYIFGVDDTVDSINARIQQDVDQMNLIDQNIQTIMSITASTIQASPAIAASLGVQLNDAPQG